ncbi:MAG: ATPase, partial [Ruminococcaceae bacterium]|nr:ATPase [Oscillospiraceae bacterium]
GDYVWASEFKNGIWTYDVNEAWTGIKTALKDVDNLLDVKYAGVSGMMHGYLAFDENWNLLVPFRTWQNTITAEAAAELTELFGFNIPQRWSVAHLYQAVLNNEEHIKKVAHITTLAGYIHYMLTGVNTVGIGEASGIFPIDSEILDYDKIMIDKFEKVAQEKGMPWKVSDVLPKVAAAGENAGSLTKEGAELIDNLLPEGTKFAPPEGDAGTGMTATNAIAVGTGNVSAGTSIFSMVVLDKHLENVYEEIDMVTTPSGKPVAMVHCNNCTNDSNAWVSVLKETLNLFDVNFSSGELYTKLYEKSLEGDADCGGILVCNYMAGEGITHLDEGRPFVIRKPDSKFTLANFFRATLYSTMVTLKIGMKILEKENVEIKSLTGHGGLFKTPVVGQRYMAAACKAPVTVMKTAGEGGPYGIALLAAFVAERKENETLEEYLDTRVFKNIDAITIQPDTGDINGFDKYAENYIKLLHVEKSAIENI